VYIVRLENLRFYSSNFRFIDMGFFDGGWKPLDTAAECGGQTCKTTSCDHAAIRHESLSTLREFFSFSLSPPPPYQFCARTIDDGDSCRYIYTYYCTEGTGMGFTILVIVIIIIIIITRTYTTMRLNGDDDGYQPNGFWPWMFIIGLGHRFITCIRNEPGPNVLHKHTQLQYLHGVCVGVHRLSANPSARKTTSEKCKCNWYACIILWCVPFIRLLLVATQNCTLFLPVFVYYIGKVNIEFHWK